ncbi:probable LRR receptor-like serine/threonine-protein kinase At5g45780 [Durio zibethinus]|uniref:Probable LRR receptor-like serine/threonine-protein kinase At5g45780 n=1 Tax=Durio zibethinus TaxID=66656 RepID=A0A6P5WXH7_DURZI|nr:probable LRR receptor-like serine/threonine-protein kinase At5g45780 [Durio zibethinus]
MERRIMLLVAVKRLKDLNFTGELQFQTETEMIGLALHRSLLRLNGFCMTPDVRLLVYPYMPNGSVADRLRGSAYFSNLSFHQFATSLAFFILLFSLSQKPSLNWNRGMHIALGLLYLHEQCNPKIIYRDVKAANIFLDESFEAVFKCMVLYLEKALGPAKTQSYKPWLPEIFWLERYLHDEKRLEVLIDRDLKGCFDALELEKTAELALQCTQSEPHHRGKMSEFLKVLEDLVLLLLVKRFVADSRMAIFNTRKHRAKLD